MNVLHRNTILIGDVRDQLAILPEASIDCVISSPPFYQLRDYGVSGQIGLESHVNEWVEELRVVMAGIARVLKPTGSVWLDLGDSYSKHQKYGAKPKSLLMAPERLALKLLDDGWIIRNSIIWSKTNPMPSSVTDRLNATYDTVYLLVRSKRYYFDLDMIRKPHRSHSPRNARPEPTRPPGWSGPLAGNRDGLRRARPDGVPGHWLGANPGDVWLLPASNFRGAHFATFPEAFVRTPLLAGCPEAICTACGIPWKRPVTIKRIPRNTKPKSKPDRYVNRYSQKWDTLRQVGELSAGCDCGAPTKPGVVLDPFFGAGTVGVVAEAYGRDWLGIELNPAYAALAEKRIAEARHKQRSKAA